MALLASSSSSPSTIRVTGSSPVTPMESRPSMDLPLMVRFRCSKTILEAKSPDRCTRYSICGRLSGVMPDKFSFCVIIFLLPILFLI